MANSAEQIGIQDPFKKIIGVWSTRRPTSPSWHEVSFVTTEFKMIINITQLLFIKYILYSKSIFTHYWRTIFKITVFYFERFAGTFFSSNTRLGSHRSSSDFSNASSCCISTCRRTLSIHPICPYAVH